jgi:hypothetical protein
MQRSKVHIVLLMLFAIASAASAADFSAVAPSGQTLYYRIVPSGVQLTYPANLPQPTQGWSGFTKPTGILTIPASVVYNGTTYSVVAVDKFAFYGCSGLTKVTVPEGVGAIRASAFRGCTAIDSLSLPASLDSLYGYSLADCQALTALRIGRSTPPVCLANAFSGDSLAAATLYVPCGMSSVYTGMAPWSQFGAVVDEACNVTFTVTANYTQRGTVSGGGIYPAGTNVVLNAVPADGYCFVCWNDGDTLNPRIVTASVDRAFTAFFFAVQHDTVLLGATDSVVHDTVHILDTVYPDFAHLTVTTANPSQGIAAGNATVPVGTVIEIAAIPLEGSVFGGWSDGSPANPRSVQVNGDMAFTAIFSPASSIDVAGLEWTAFVEEGLLTVNGRVGDCLRLYDMQGRCLLSVAKVAATTSLKLPAKGVYLLQMGDGPARKIDY